jgi:hypothetical protein
MSEAKHNGRVVGLTFPYEHVHRQSMYIAGEMYTKDYSSLGYDDVNLCQ